MSAKLILIRFHSNQNLSSISSIEKVMEKFLFVRRITDSQWLFLNLSDVCSNELYSMLKTEVKEPFDIIELDKETLHKKTDLLNYEIPDPYRTYIQIIDVREKL